MGEKTFRYKKALQISGAMDLYGLDRETAIQLTEDVNELIKQALLDQREEFREMVRMKTKQIPSIKYYQDNPNKCISLKNEGYNQALKDILKELKT